MRTKIEWCDYSINPVKGLCPVACDYCYARKMYKRFKWNPEIRFQAGEFLGLPYKPSRVFVGSTIELFGDWIEPQWMDLIFDAVRVRPRHTFIFLTKRPRNLIKWSPFPENCWVGVSATDEAMVLNAVNHLFNHRIAKTQFLSIEPLLSWDTSKFVYPFANSISKKDLDLIIVGQQTPVKKSITPRIEWIRAIVEVADKAGIPVFLKDNLLELVNYESPETAFAFNKEGYYRQEFPK